jgi:hypothetical protein
MDLTHEELEEYLLRIFTGIKLVCIEGIDLIFKQPDNLTKLKANYIYKKAYDSAVEEGILPIKDLEKLMEDRGLFTEKDREQIDKLESQIHGQQVVLSKTTRIKANQERIKKVIEDLTSKLNKLRMKKYSKLVMSAETKAEEDRAAFLCCRCAYNSSNDLFWKNHDELLKETRISLRQSIISEFTRFYSGIETKIIRSLARSNLWRIRYITSAKVSEPIFGIPTSQYSNDMLNLAYWSNFYQSIYEMMPEDRPSDLIIDDDESLDAYMKDYYEERNREDASRKSRKTKGKLSAFDKEEVIVTQSNDLYQDIKYDKPKEAQRVKDRVDIRKRTKGYR